MAVAPESRICLRVGCWTKYCFMALRLVVEMRPLRSHIVNSPISRRGGRASNPSPRHMKSVVVNIVLGQDLFRMLRGFPISIILIVPHSHAFICYQPYAIPASDTVIKYYI
jgi:hypothetical protein